ncbi:MAG: FKBP-type peptidyl-prolyl cis-trans isomerase [Hydrogenophaga sp.]|jgi:FKBP-type peptidyl-prolyl cis-trans isomerase FkpA|uniref:FKBP-type peptidyl-prolyl cis-trans isomerase n=1 Tax=Hydrogenophaga sp. TaxID=1904254 RepID=UPI0025C6B524|nr:FKBP-type peptidyl-prolyl cis-trans isomerase [Hydrogenophaga sp.]MDP2074820.1 FKBP-type peptidyl-prolyl cis-trans isomerase [Hydrogenophaga sp.]MDP2985483.1 FKBP-type peptidyl-prolyl cis-trans isomerase [Hydrogenophaga sp.]MDP3108903.1 FKBP-type peptidyl-prolyl cis-trans isomerase [Hydrogenophaga sp.]MDP3204047.1 FKBP-type peptidyl-prolyl cis-trans isomerase [Hydrogenophaga sp.]MDP3350093.1 FKBP-type peptidyl-prolyl cis-trans isomerase [Hydrogenophaga sp.]
MKTILQIAAVLTTLSVFSSAHAQTAGALPADKVLPSGVALKWTAAGTGEKPLATDTVQVHYRGKLTDGKEFDSSFKRGEPATFPLNRVVPCWTQALQEMKVGDTADVTCPPATAYGERGIPGVIPANSVLQFQVQLLAVKKR